MQYLCLIFEAETIANARTDEQNGALYGAYSVFSEDIEKSGQYVGGNALMPTDTATTVRVRDGETLISDGPFAETKEQLGGYYLLECANLDEAIASAAKIPSAKDGCVEVRPIMVFDE